MYYSAAWYVYCRDQLKSINECGKNPNESPRPCRGSEVWSNNSSLDSLSHWQWQSREYAGENIPSTRCFTSSCSFKVHKTFPRITVNKLPRLPPASISYSSAISLFLRKNLGEKRLYSKIFQWPTACFQQPRHEPDVVNIIDSVTQG